MADFSYSTDREIQRLNAQVVDEPESFEHWENLIRAAEAQEGGLNRNSSPQAIAATRDTYDRFLARFPLFFGYWKKYADLEFNIGGTESAEMVYERGVASIGISVDLWANYCGFKIDTCHDADVIRELFERGADSVGLDFLAHPFWDKYIDFEERMENQDAIFAIHARIIHYPLHQYARYFERYRNMAANRKFEDLITADQLARFQREIGGGRNPAEMERELRSRIDALKLETFQRTQAETSKRWTYEQEIKRPYYHVTELDESQLSNWRKYLDFEEGEGNYQRVKFLYERCLVTCANYDEFWYRYARWTLGQSDKTKEVRQEEVRNIYRRTSCIYVSIFQPEIRLYYARFEESLGRADVAIAIHKAILDDDKVPGHLETIISLANTHRRQYGVDAAIGVLREHINKPHSSVIKGSLIAEWARLLWTVKGDASGARGIFRGFQHEVLDCRKFWIDWLEFEKSQPTSEKQEPSRYESVKAVYDTIRSESQLQSHTLQEISSSYLSYLEERGDKNAMAEWTELDAEINGPFSVSSGMKKSKTASNGHSKDALMMEMS